MKNTDANVTAFNHFFLSNQLFLTNISNNIQIQGFKLCDWTGYTDMDT